MFVLLLNAVPSGCAGDILYIPTHMYHQIRSSGSPNIAANIWFFPFNLDEELQQFDIPESDVIRQTVKFNEMVELHAPLAIECNNLSPSLKLVLNTTTENDQVFSPTEIKEASAAVPLTVLLKSGYRS